MKVDIILSEENIDPSNVYLEGMKGYPNPKCQPTVKDHVAQFELPLRDFYECGVTRIVYKLNVSKNCPKSISIFHPECYSTRSSSSSHSFWNLINPSLCFMLCLFYFRERKCSITK